jgi:hypothetical protein
LRAKWKIFLAPCGRYGLSQNVQDGAKDFWLPIGEHRFVTMPEAQAALGRVIRQEHWLFNEDGSPYEPE